MRLTMLLLPVMLLFARLSSVGQTGRPLIISTDSTTQTKNPAFTRDTTIKIVNNDTIKTAAKHNPGTATLRSLILPGWGQAYNREYWKIPIVYGAIGAMAGIFIYNNTWYKRTRDAYDLRVNSPNSPDTANIHERLKPFRPSDLVIFRNSFRRDRDYSTLYFLLVWGLNVADATVFGHLRQFDVSEDLSLKINPVLRLNSPGFSLVLQYKSPSPKVNRSP